MIFLPYRTFCRISDDRWRSLWYICQTDFRFPNQKWLLVKDIRTSVMPVVRWLTMGKWKRSGTYGQWIYWLQPELGNWLYYIFQIVIEPFNSLLIVENLIDDVLVINLGAGEEEARKYFFIPRLYNKTHIVRWIMLQKEYSSMYKGFLGWNPYKCCYTRF